MRIEFIKQINDPNAYLILENNREIYTAHFDKATESKLLYTLDGSLIGRGFYFASYKNQFIEDYLIQLMKDSLTETITIKTKSWFFQTKKFSFRDFGYIVIPHRGTKFSIFRGEIQVASYQTYNFFSRSNKMILMCDDNLPRAFFCLLSLHLFSDFGNEGNSPNSPVNFWFQAKKNNNKWKPNRNF